MGTEGTSKVEYKIGTDSAGLFNAVTRTLAKQGHRVYFDKRLVITSKVFEFINRLGKEHDNPPWEV